MNRIQKILNSAIDALRSGKDPFIGAKRRAFGKTGKPIADWAGAAQAAVRRAPKLGLEPKADLSPRLATPPVSPDVSHADMLSLPPPPEPVAIPERMWLAGAIGALLAPRAAGAMLTAPVRWKLQQDADALRSWNAAADKLLKQLEVQAKLMTAGAEQTRADAYAQGVQQQGALIPYRADLMSAQADAQRMNALRSLSEILMQQHRLNREQAETLSELYLRAGDPRVGLNERRKLLQYADDYARSIGADITPDTVRAYAPSLQLPEAARSTGGDDDTIRTGENARATEVDLSPAQQKTLADARASEALAELQAERQETERATRERKLQLMDAELLIKAKTLEKIDADIRATQERLRLMNEELGLRRAELNLRQRNTSLRELITYQRHWATQLGQIERAIDAIKNEPAGGYTEAERIDPQTGTRLRERIPRYSDQQLQRLKELDARRQEVEGTLKTLEETLDKHLLSD